MPYKYVDLVKNTSEYATRMQRLSKRIFGEVARPTSIKSTKVIRLFSAPPIDKNRDITEYYPRHVEMGILMKKLRFYGLFRDEHLDFKDEMNRLRRIRGRETEFKQKFRTQQAQYLKEELEKLQKTGFK